MTASTRFLKLHFWIVTLMVFPTYLIGQKQELKDSLDLEALDEIIVVATRTKREFSSLPLPALLVSKKEIERTNSLRLSDLLDEQTGLVMVPDFGGVMGVQIQGLDSQYVSILIDGLPLIGRSAGTFDLNRISVGNIAQVEIVKGASSSLYGNEALAGVINIITGFPEKEGLGGFLNLRAGNPPTYHPYHRNFGYLHTFDANLGIQYRNGKHDIRAYLNNLHSEGYDLNQDQYGSTVEPYGSTTAEAKWRYRFTDDSFLSLSGRYFNQWQSLLPPPDIDNYGTSITDEFNLNAKLQLTFSSKWKGFFDGYTSRYIFEELPRSEGNYFDQNISRLELRSNYEPNGKNSLVFGTGITFENIERSDFLGSPFFRAPFVFGQLDSQPLKDFNLIFGIRADWHNEYPSQISPKLALRYDFSKKFAIRGSVGSGYKAPDFRQLYFNFSNSTVGYSVFGQQVVAQRVQELEEEGRIVKKNVPLSEFDDPLNAESSVNINLGFTFSSGNLYQFNVNLFRNDVKNLIETSAVARLTNGQQVFSYSNLESVFTQGLEVSMKYYLGQQWRFNAGYQLLYARDLKVKDEFEQGQVFARLSPSQPAFSLTRSDYFGLYNRSRHTANIKLFYVHSGGGFDANIRGVYRSQYGLFDTNGNNYLDIYDEFVDGFVTWDISLSKRILKFAKINVGVDNLLNYTNPAQISSLPGRLYYLTLKLSI